MSRDRDVIFLQSNLLPIGLTHIYTRRGHLYKPDGEAEPHRTSSGQAAALRWYESDEHVKDGYGRTLGLSAIGGMFSVKHYEVGREHCDVQ